MTNHGQASLEYVAILLVVGALLAGATALAVAAPGVGERVVKTVRTGLCIVGGDVCRSADAAAAGLEPCVTSARSRRQETTLDLAVVRLGEHGEWELALQSDGQAVVTRLEGEQAGGVVGVGLTFSPARVSVDAEAALVAGYNSGRAWRFPDARSATAFLVAAMDAEHDASSKAAARARARGFHARALVAPADASKAAQQPALVAPAEGALPAPDVRWDALGAEASAEAGVAVADLTRAGVATQAESVLGLRTDGARRTLALNVGLDEPGLFADLPGFATGTTGARRSWIVEVSWERGAARELALRTAGGDGGRLVQYSARLDLREPGNLAAAERLLHPGGRTLADVRALAARISSHGVIERAGYDVTERRSGFSLAARLGVALGLARHRITSERRLVDAVAWVRGGPPQRRFDCLGA